MNGSSRNKKVLCSLLGGELLSRLSIQINPNGRNKEPEYALYMLNRATIKNVLWPLIPNEMRVTPTVDDMLIVERRGEGTSTYWMRA